MHTKYVWLALWLAGAAFPDSLTLRNGRVVTGNYLGGTPRQIKMEVGDRIETFDIGDVASLVFQGTQAPAPSAPAMAVTPLAPPTATAAPQTELPAGTNLVIRMIDAVDSERSRVGQTFRASLDQPVIVNGYAVIPRGADAIVRLVDERASGKLAGRASLTLNLASVSVEGRMVDINTQSVSETSSNRAGRTAGMGVGGAAVGAAIGGIAGGGRGAAIGAGSGAAVGVGSQVLTKGQRVRIPSETRLTFVLDVSVRI